MSLFLVDLDFRFWFKLYAIALNGW